MTGYSLLLRYDKVVHESYLFFLCLFTFALASLIRRDIFFLNYSPCNPFASRNRFRSILRSTLLFNRVMQYLILQKIIKHCSGRLSRGSSGRRTLLLLLPVCIKITTKHLHDLLLISVRDRLSHLWLLSLCLECSGCSASVTTSSGLGPVGCCCFGLGGLRHEGRRVGGGRRGHQRVLRLFRRMEA